MLGLREAAAAIGTAAPATIVLIHDDVDNCGQDVCAAAAEIAKANPGLTVHTIGLGLDKPKLQQMSCVATLTGGKLYNAQDARRGRVRTRSDHQARPSRSGRTRRRARTERGPRSQARQAAPPEAPPGLYLSAGLGPDSATLESPVRWRVTKSGADGEVVREAKAPSLVEKLPPGSYDVEARLGLAAAQPDPSTSRRTRRRRCASISTPACSRCWRAPPRTAQPLQAPVFTVTPVATAAESKNAAPALDRARGAARDRAAGRRLPGHAPRTASPAKSRRSRSRQRPGPRSTPCWRRAGSS